MGTESAWQESQTVQDSLERPAGVPRRAEPPPCVIGEYCRDHGFIHGAEAEELRERVEKILDQVDHEGDDAADALDRALRMMLDDVDARDSCAFRDILAGRAEPLKET